MGNDGGSIPDRRDLVRNKPKAEQADKANQLRARWFFCALSKRPLQEPIVSCDLGKLYNKDSIIEYLIDKSSYGDGQNICGHIRSLKDVTTLKLTPNPTPQESSSVNASTDRALFICPLSLKEMNGVQPFVYISTCGCVISQASLRAMSGASSSTPPPEDAVAQLDVCPQCATKFDKARDVLLLNPSANEEERMLETMEKRRLAEPAKLKSKSKKRKAEVAEEVEAPSKKKIQPGLNPTITAASRAVVSSLAEEEAKRKDSMSDAVKSLYGGGKPKRKETFMTMGTFTRYA